jgi:hypothetical protein
MRSSSLRAVAVGALALPAALVPAATAAAALPSEPVSVRIADAKRQFCATRAVTGTGVERRAYTAPADGVFAARLSGRAGSDYDVAVLDADGDRVMSGSAGSGSDELATAIVKKGQGLVVQVCRRSGSARSVQLRLAMAEFVEPAASKPSTEKTRLVRVQTKSRFDAYRLSQLGLDTTDHPSPSHWDVLLYSDADERKLQQAGFTYTVRTADVVASDRADRLTEQRAKRRAEGTRAAATTGIPSGRTTYRTLPEIEEDLKRLAQENPGFVRLFKLPLPSWEGREILGVEIAENVTGVDGRPAYVQVGTHHAREWPANEATLEWGLELVQGYKDGDPRLSQIVKGARNYIIPVLNVDGFDATIKSEGLAPGGNYSDPGDSGTPSGSQGFGTGAYKRKNCRPLDATQPVVPGECLARTFPSTLANRDLGVDPNRNYGVEWGGPGTSSRVESLVYHGPGPVLRARDGRLPALPARHAPTVLITNHTYTGLILRPPGTKRVRAGAR